MGALDACGVTNYVLIDASQRLDRRPPHAKLGPGGRHIHPLSEIGDLFPFGPAICAPAQFPVVNGLDRT